MEELENRIRECLCRTYIECPDCEDMYSDDQYTCTTCWCEGGQGTIKITELITYDIQGIKRK